MVPVATDAAAFYSAFARGYDLLARAPGVDHVRRRVATALDPAVGDTVVDLGCGTGGNHPALRREIGPTGTYVGVDVAPGVLEIARRREGGPRTAFLRGDAARPPLPDGGADAVCATFLVGMLAEPTAAVRSWARTVGPGGRLAVANLSRTARTPWWLCNPAFRLAVRLGSPGRPSLGESSAVERLERRVDTAHTAVRRLCEPASTERFAFGFGRLTVGTVRPTDEWPSASRDTAEHAE